MKKLLTNLLFLSCISMSFAQAPNNGLVGFYPFLNSSGDFSGNNINPVVAGTKLSPDRFNTSNSSYYFNGMSDRMVITHDGSKINFNTDFTVSLWFKLDTTINTDFTLLSSRHNTGGGEQGGVEIVGTNKGIQALRVGSNCNFVLTDSIKETKNWTNITLVGKKSKSTFYLYQNGRIVDSVFAGTCGSITTGSSPLIIGANYTANNSWFTFFKGNIDDIRIYNRALSYPEIISTFNEGKCFEKVTVSDTLKITGTVLGLNDLPQNFGLLKIYPNPAHDILNIATSNPTSRYSIKIVNSTSQTVYSGVLSQSITQVNMSSFGTQGLYIIQILDESNKVLETKKLILE